MNEALLHSIEEKIDRTLSEAEARGITHNIAMARYHLSTGGKRLRALIPCQIYEVMGKNPSDILPLSVAIELIHNATLVHDDLQDGDESRRGQPTVWKKFSAAQAINCGDALLYLGGDALLDLQASPAILVGLQRMIFRSVLKVIEGQSQEFLMQKRAETKLPCWDEYAAMTEGKTSALLGIPVAGTLFCAGIDAQTCAHFETAAKKLGLLFQIQDDVLDIFGNKGRDVIASDIYEGKISALVVEFCESRASNSEKERVLKVLRTPRAQTTVTMVDEVIAAFRQFDVLGGARIRIQKIQSDLENNADLNRLPAVKNYLIQLTRKFLEPIAKI